MTEEEIQELQNALEELARLVKQAENISLVPPIMTAHVQHAKELEALYQKFYLALTNLWTDSRSRGN